MTKMGELSI